MNKKGDFEKELFICTRMKVPWNINWTTTGPHNFSSRHDKDLKWTSIFC